MTFLFSGVLAEQVFSKEPTQTIGEAVDRRQATIQAVSYATYRVMKDLYVGATLQADIDKLLDAQMEKWSFDVNDK